MSGYQPFAVTVRGGSHKKDGIPCQDACHKYEGDGFAIAAVADGHGDGNCFRSDKGANFAVRCATKGMAEFVKIHAANLSEGKDTPLQNDPDKAIRNLINHIIAAWQAEVEGDYAAHPFAPEELAKADERHRRRFEAGDKPSKAYGTTLIAFAVTGHYWFGIHIGDGRFTALYPDGEFNQPIPWDEKCYLNVTTSICDDDASDRARHWFSFIDKEKPAPAAVFLCTDGIDDNYPVDGNEKHLFKLYRTIALTFVQDGFDSTCKQLADLADAFATKGKGDDTSIAGFIDMGALKQAAPVWQRQVDEEEKATVGKTETEEPEAERPKETGLFAKFLRWLRQ